MSVNKTKAFDLRGRVALLTGASAGLGAHFAHVLANNGAKVIVGARREDRLVELVQSIRSEGCRGQTPSVLRSGPRYLRETANNRRESSLFSNSPPADTSVETAIATVEQALTNDLTIEGARSAIQSWRETLTFIESLGGAGYDALAQSSYAGLYGS